MAKYAEGTFKAYLIVYGLKPNDKTIVITDKGPKDAIDIFTEDSVIKTKKDLEKVIISIEQINANIYLSDNFKTRKL